MAKRLLVMATKSRSVLNKNFANKSLEECGMSFYKLLLVVPMLCVPMLANAEDPKVATPKMDGGIYAGIISCIGGPDDAMWIEERDCIDWTNDTHAQDAKCKKFKAAGDKGWKKLITYDVAKEKGGYEYTLTDEFKKSADIYRCVVTECKEPDKYEVKDGYCQKKKPAAPAVGDKGGESANGGDNATDTPAVPQDLAEAIAKLDTVMVGADKSVWKDKEGNFNTARLVSDSIAGVVLGTAGGLITSNIVKKNQLKKGFEDIKCTIGGQEVAGYGDEIKVGVK